MRRREGRDAGEYGFVVWLKVVGTGEGVLPPSVSEQMLKMCGAEEAGVALWQVYGVYLKRKSGFDGRRCGLGRTVADGGAGSVDGGGTPRIGGLLESTRERDGGGA